jgi:hypothetical protein
MLADVGVELAQRLLLAANVPVLAVKTAER